MTTHCDRCGDTGVILVCAPDGSRETQRPCACAAADPVGHEAREDAHEAAAAAARLTDFATTDGRDWT